MKDLPDDEKYAVIKQKGKALSKRMKDWDSEMMQRKSKAYDDVENFPNKLTANYLFVINQTESDIPSVNMPSRDRLQELSSKWSTLKATAMEIMEKGIPAYNQLLWNVGIGAVWADRK